MSESGPKVVDDLAVLSVITVAVTEVAVDNVVVVVVTTVVALLDVGTAHA